MSCYWYNPEGGLFSTCDKCAPDSSHQCPSNGDIEGCDLWSPFGGYAGVEMEHYEFLRAIREMEEEELCAKDQQ